MRQYLALLAAGVLGDGLGALTDSVLGKLSGEEETDGSLDLATGDRRSLVVVSQTGGLGGDALEDIVDKAVHDGHSLAADTGVGVHLLQHLVDVDGIAFLALPLALLVAGANRLRLTGLLRAFRADFGRHCVYRVCWADKRLTGRERAAYLYTLQPSPRLAA